jgi:hypothetical protein
MMVFTVEDQGVGIPKDQQRGVFDRFESRSQGSGRASRSHSRSVIRAQCNRSLLTHRCRTEGRLLVD